MKNRSIVFTGCDQVEVQLLEENLDQLQAHEVLVKTSFSLVSAGTELLCLAGSESWFTFPSTPGYTSVGEVVKVGDQVVKVAPGEMVYTWGGHKQYNRIDLAEARIDLHTCARWYCATTGSLHSNDNHCADGNSCFRH